MVVLESGRRTGLRGREETKSIAFWIRARSLIRGSIEGWRVIAIGIVVGRGI